MEEQAKEILDHWKKVTNSEGIEVRILAPGVGINKDNYNAIDIKRSKLELVIKQKVLHEKTNTTKGPSDTL